MPITALIHITSAYSNAVLVAIMPHVNDFAKKMDLPIPLPITVSGQLKPASDGQFKTGHLK